VREPGGSPWYRRLLANHPPPARRRAVLERPELVAEVTFVDGFTAGFLATLAMPLIEQVSVTLFMGSGRSDLGKVAAALIAGPLLGGSVGLGLARAALVRRVAAPCDRHGSRSALPPGWWPGGLPRSPRPAPESLGALPFPRCWW